jgi:Tetratricopeptide repeat
LDDAVGLQVEVLRAMKNSLGELHPHTLIAKGNIALFYQKQGRLDDAVGLEEEVLACRVPKIRLFGI